ERAKTLSHDSRIYNLVNDPIIPATPVYKIWEKPPRGGFKEETSTEWAESYAFEESLKKSWSLNISKIDFETDNTSLVNKMKKHERDTTIMGPRINEIQKVMDNFHSATICWVIVAVTG
ncbi:hypothetical protein Gohar_008910, partial [Gossypium harknessii]|nr:hypothetical protein [Gossypium harknessii]